MPNEAFVGLAAVLASLLIQVLKDRIGVAKGFLPILALFAGALASAATAAGTGMDAEAVAANGVGGALISRGTHAALLANEAWLGRTLKGKRRD